MFDYQILRILRAENFTELKKTISLSAKADRRYLRVHFRKLNLNQRNVLDTHTFNYAHVNGTLVSELQELKHLHCKFFIYFT